MEIGTRSTLVKSTPTRGTPQKRKQDSIGGCNKRIKFELSHLEEECRKAHSDNVPSVVLSMGSGDTGQLGLGEDVMEKKRPTVIPDLKDIIEIRAGGMHSICLSKTGKVYTFGCNDEGALGRTVVEDEDATVPMEVVLPADVVVSDITAGDNHSSILTDDGKVYIWGSFRDNNGLIGLLKPMEKLIEPTLVPLDKKIVKVASGENHFAMLTESGDILTFGCAEQGQLGRVSPNHLVRGGRGGLAPQLTPGAVRVRHNVKFCDLWAGAFCTIGKSIEGDVYGCGLNNYNQLGVDEDLLQLMMTGLNEFNKLGESWRSFVFGQHHTMALTASSHVFVIGRGEYGNLGQGDNEHQKNVTEVKLVSSDIRTIAACNRTSYALMNDGTVYSWGMGSSYQLGHGDDEDVNVPTKMVGKQIAEKKIIEISPGFQHVLFRAIPRTSMATIPEVTPVETPKEVAAIEIPIETLKEVAPIEEKEVSEKKETAETATDDVQMEITQEMNVESENSDSANQNEETKLTNQNQEAPIETMNNEVVEEKEVVNEEIVSTIDDASVENKTETNDTNNNSVEQMEVDKNTSS